MDTANQNDINCMMFLFGFSEKQRQEALAYLQLFEIIFPPQNKFYLQPGTA